MLHDPDVLTVRDIGRLGGQAVLEKHGVEHLRRIGGVGGRAFDQRHGHGMAPAMRQRGGETVKERYGDEHFVALGRKGGASTVQRHGRERYQELGRLVHERYGSAHYARLSAMSEATLSYLDGLGEIRTRRGLTYAALARRSGVSRPAIRAFERLERGARRATVQKLADAMGVEPEQLLHGSARHETERPREVTDFRTR